MLSQVIFDLGKNQYHPLECWLIHVTGELKHDVYGRWQRLPLISLLTAWPWAERGSCSTRGLFFNCVAMGRARFMFYTLFFFFYCMDMVWFY